MGAWGLESCSNDACWDQLECEDIHQPKESEIEKSLKNSSAFLTGDPHDEETFVGVIIWALRHNVKVKKPYLKKGISAAKSMLKNKSYLAQWSNTPFETREEHLKNEINLMEDALKNDGQPSNSQNPPEGLLSKLVKNTK